MLHSFLNGPPTTKLSTLSLHDALPISSRNSTPRWAKRAVASPVPTRSGRGMRSLRAIGWNGASALALAGACARPHRSEEHTSELQSQSNLVCRLLLEKKKQN